jgi:hypothetical protein
MTVDKAKEFLVELADNEDAAAQVDAAYFEALKSAAAELGYTVSDDDLTMALVEMTGLGDNDTDEVEGFVGYRDSLLWVKGPSGGPRLFGDPLKLQPRTFGI